MLAGLGFPQQQDRSSEKPDNLSVSSFFHTSFLSLFSQKVYRDLFFSILGNNVSL